MMTSKLWLAEDSFLHHVGGKRVLINLHRSLGSLKFKLSLLESQLNLLSEDFAFICIMQSCIVPLAILHVLELFFRRDLMIRL